MTQGVNTYAGTFAAANQIDFTSVAYDTSQPALSFELHGVQVDPSASPLGYQYLETSGIAGVAGLGSISNGIQLVAVNEDAPEPSTFGLFSLALAAAGIRRRFR